MVDDLWGGATVSAHCLSGLSRVGHNRRAGPASVRGRNKVWSLNMVDDLWCCHAIRSNFIGCYCRIGSGDGSSPAGGSGRTNWWNWCFDNNDVTSCA